MAIYYDKENSKFYTSKKTSSSVMVLDELKLHSDHSYHHQNFTIEDSPIKYIGFELKNGWKVWQNGKYQYDDVLYISVGILHKSNTYLAPMTKLSRFFKDDDTILKSAGSLDSFYFKIDEKVPNWECQLEKVYRDVCWVCNTNEVWLFKDMLKFLPEFDRYAESSKKSDYFIYVLAEVLRYVLKYGQNINEEFLLTAKERLLSYAYDELEDGTRRLNILMRNGGDNQKLYGAVSTIKEFIDECRKL